MQKQLANFKQKISPYRIYSAKTIEPLITDYIARDFTLESTIKDNPDRYIIFLYEKWLRPRNLESGDWVSFTWIFDKETRNRLRIHSADLDYIKENYSPLSLEIY